MPKTYQHQTVAEADETLNAILDIIDVGTWDWQSVTGKVIRSPAWYTMFGYPINSLENTVNSWERLIHPEDIPKVMHQFDEFINGDQPTCQIEYRCRRADGTYMWTVDKAKILARQDDGTVVRMVGAQANIDEWKRAQLDLEHKNQLLKDGNLTLERLLEEKNKQLEKKNAELKYKIACIEELSFIDDLTKINNRKRFEEELTREISRCKRYQHALSLAIFDIDYFKRVNDEFGHSGGDKVLKTLAETVSQNIRDVDFFARWGGEEFVIILPDLNGEEASEVCDKLRNIVAKQSMPIPVEITCSFGIASCQQEDNVDSLFARADQALYRAKGNGRNRVEVNP